MDGPVQTYGKMCPMHSKHYCLLCSSGLQMLPGSKTCSAVIIKMQRHSYSTPPKYVDCSQSRSAAPAGTAKPCPTSNKSLTNTRSRSVLLPAENAPRLVQVWPGATSPTKPASDCCQGLRHQPLAGIGLGRANNLIIKWRACVTCRVVACR